MTVIFRVIIISYIILIPILLAETSLKEGDFLNRSLAGSFYLFKTESKCFPITFSPPKIKSAIFIYFYGAKYNIVKFLKCTKAFSEYTLENTGLL